VDLQTMIRNCLLSLALLVLAACATPAATLRQDAEAAAITRLLKAQDDAWNAGDIEGFMKGYRVSDELRFASGGDVVRGYDATLARYKTRYPGPEGMGELSTTDYEIDILSRDAAIAHGRWQVVRDGEILSGLYTLVLRKDEGGWVIVSDTTTSAE
jgi:ketosteroid isomerase-like protein